jgi:hypothetical protein
MDVISLKFASRGYRALSVMGTFLCIALMLCTQSSTALASVNNDSSGSHPTGGPPALRETRPSAEPHWSEISMSVSGEFQ